MAVPLPDRRHGALVAAAIALALAVSAPALALEGVAVVDYQAVFDSYDGTGDAQRTLDRELKDWDAEAQQMRDAIAQLTEEIESQRLMLSEDRLREKQSELDRLRLEYQEFAESIWGVNGKAAQRNAELTRPIAEKILDVIAKVGQEMDLKIILDAGTGGVVWAEDDVNITKAVLDDLSLSLQQAAPAEAPAESPDDLPPALEGAGGEE
jgi:Skp family chaperone for outer membrane proteins